MYRKNSSPPFAKMLGARRNVAGAAESGAKAELADFLKDADPDIRFLAVKWVSDEKLAEFRPQLLEMLKNNALNPREFIAISTRLARIDGKPVNENSLADYFLQRLKDTAAPVSARMMALRAIPAAHKQLRTELLVGLLKQDDPEFRIEVLRALKDRGDAQATSAVLDLARDARQPAAVRAQAVLTLSALTGDPAAFVALTADDATRDEAFRALVGTKLTYQQGARLLAAVNGKPGSAEMYRRVVGKALGDNAPQSQGHRRVAEVPRRQGRPGGWPPLVRVAEAGGVLQVPSGRGPRGEHRPGPEPHRPHRAKVDRGIDPSTERGGRAALSGMES